MVGLFVGVGGAAWLVCLLVWEGLHGWSVGVGGATWLVWEGLHGWFVDVGGATWFVEEGMHSEEVCQCSNSRLAHQVHVSTLYYLDCNCTYH